MLEDVRYPSGIRRIGLEADREYIIVVIASDVKVFGPGLFVLELKRGQFQFWYMFRPL